jgi:hypothetical protein
MNNESKNDISFTDDVDCPWLDDVDVLFDGKIPPDKFAKRFTGDEAFGIFETIFDDDLLKSKKKKKQQLIHR